MDIPLPANFADPASAVRRIQKMKDRQAGEFPVTFQHLFHALESAADADRSLTYFERFAENYGAELFPVLEKNPRVIEILVTLFSASQFLTEILLRNPQSLALLLDIKTLTQRKTIEQFQSEAEAAATLAGDRVAFNRYQHGELLRIGACDFLALYDFPAVVSQLSRMAIGLTRACLHYAAQQTNTSTHGFVVLAMGKLGGRELNYSSDIDLLFISKDDSVNYIPLAQKLIDLLAANTAEGFLYRVDLRLRPWGNDGPLVATVQGYMRYIEKNARLWEKQALLKVRPIAGDLSLGEHVREMVQPYIFSAPPEEVRAGVFAMKQRTEEFLQSKGRGWGEVKLGVGSIRDVEFVLQYLQLTNVSQHPQIRTRATLKGLRLLRAAGLITSVEARILSDGYTFLRTIEHYLQMMDYRQTYTLPSDEAAIAFVARRLGFKSGESFVERYQEHCKAIREIYLRYVGNESAPAELPAVSRHIARMDVSYTKTFTPEEIHRHAELAQKMNAQTPAIVEAIPSTDNSWRVTIVGYDYPGELSIICGLFFVHGFDILDGSVFTYEASKESPATTIIRRGKTTRRAPQDSADTRQKIVDVFTVKSVYAAPPEKMWETYTQDLHALLTQFHAGQRREARGQLAKRVGAAFQAVQGTVAPLLPIDIEIDNEVSDRYTVLRIDAPDTIGFLYEFANALAFTRTNIVRVNVSSAGNRVHDVLYVTDADGMKIVAPEKQRELRAAIVLIKHFTHLLPTSPNPESALLHFREFLEQLFQRPNWTDEIASIERPDVLGALTRLLGVSDFLWDDFLRMQYANLFPVVRDMDALATAKPRQQLDAELNLALESLNLGGLEYPNWRAALNAFKDRELFRIDMRHILGLTREFWDFAAELTELAEIIIGAALTRCDVELRGDSSPAKMVALALGKCGGRELGFASDIELMFVYDDENPEASAYYEKLVRNFVSTIQARREGIFQVDLQLRPYGKAGSMAVSLESFRRYYAPTGPAWAYERQALVKLRPIAGDMTLGKEICDLRDSFTYHAGAFDVTAMRAMRERQVRHLVTGGTFNAKYSPGGLVDVEYLIQALQINHGAENPAVRVTNSREAMSALFAAGVLSRADYDNLRKAHTFLHWLIDSLRVVRGNSKDITVPSYGSDEFAFLARRLRYEKDVDRLREDLARYPHEIAEINQRLLG
jgi:glutamate-ammonia-ligase adenylyltransferase